MGSRGGEGSRQGGGWQTQQNGGLWSRVGKAAAGRKAATGGIGDRLHNPEFQLGEIKPQATD